MRPIFRFLFLGAAFLAGACKTGAVPPVKPALGAPAVGAPAIGAYVWGGYYREDASPAGLAASVRFVLDQGFGTVRIAVSPRSVGELNLGPGACTGQKDVGCILDLVLEDPVFADPRLKTLILTIGDFTTFPEHQVDPDFIAANRDRIVREYRSALAAIDRHLGITPVDVVLTNWEGDNMVYCGGVYRFAKDPQFRPGCAGGTEAGIGRRLDGLMSWFALRRATVEAYRPVSPNLRLHYAVEFNNLHILDQDCRGDGCNPALGVFRRLSSEPRPELCSYSSYDGLNRGLLDQDIATMLRVCDKVIIGEIGFPAWGPNTEKARAGYAANARALLRWKDRIFAIVFWNAFESKNAADKGYGLWTAEGAPRNITALPPALRP